VDEIMTSTNGTPETIADSSEVKSYLDRFKNQDPHEMLGLPNESGLRGAMVIATISSLAVFAALTFVPYFVNKNAMAKADKPAEKVEPAPAAKVEPAEKPNPANKVNAPATPATAGKKGETPATAAAAPANKDFPNGPEYLKKSGEGETKTAPAKSNPLEKKNDDILNDLK
jgi:hypothetical protein